MLSHVLASVEATYQNLDSIELGVTTVDHYFDTLGGISRAVRRARGGVAASVYIGDQTRGDGTVRTLCEQVSLETRTRALNPKWYEALLKHGYEGVREIDAHVTNTLGWSATTGGGQPLGLSAPGRDLRARRRDARAFGHAEPESLRQDRQPADRGAGASATGPPTRPRSKRCAAPARNSRTVWKALKWG